MCRVHYQGWPAPGNILEKVLDIIATHPSEGEGSQAWFAAMKEAGAALNAGGRAFKLFA